MTFEQHKTKYIDKFILGTGETNKGLILYVADISSRDTNNNVYVKGIDCETLKPFDHWRTSFLILDEQFEIIG